MEWYREVQFISAVPMPAEMAAEFGTTVNGMWASPEGLTAAEVAEARRAGRRALFSVPMIALTPQTYEEPDAAFLLDEVCGDIDGRPAECDWYYWESKPVYAACIYSEAFRAYLLDRCKEGVDRGMDVVNLDEIMTSIGLMDLDPGGCGFCARCLARFRMTEDGRRLAARDNAALRAAIRDDARLFDRYRRFHDREAFRVMIGFIDELRAYAASVNPGFAISANVAYLGNLVGRFGSLWGCLWGPHVDFVMMENDYRVERDEPHAILPRGKFTAWYKLGAAFNGAPNWICPSIQVPRQLADEDHRRYYELMFLEAYANAGRWGYFWWPGVDAETRRRATAPEALKTYIGFIDAHRELYEGTESIDDLAILYLEGPIMRRPETHERFLALAQALAEAGYQFDVRYTGDGEFNRDTLDAASLEHYRAILVPEARDLGPGPTAALQTYARSGGELVVFSESPFGPALVHREDGRVLDEFWHGYRDTDRDRIAASVQTLRSSRIESSDPAVNVIRRARDEQQILHLLNYAYDGATDTVAPATDVQITVPWDAAGARCTLLAPEQEQELAGRIEDGQLLVTVPRVDPYAVLILQGATG
jgi:hypothetical protein